VAEHWRLAIRVPVLSARDNALLAQVELVAALVVPMIDVSNDIFVTQATTSERGAGSAVRPHSEGNAHREQVPSFCRTCQFCGCWTNAKLRRCCQKGYAEDAKK
jgi:hypothetical protein